MKNEGHYISVRNWRKFQHYDPAKRTPPWIKVYTELMSDDAFLTLSSHLRGVLVSIWMEYASARCQLRANTSSLSRQLGVRVMTRDLESLNHAGFIDIVASNTLAEGYQAASTTLASRAPARSLETEAEEEQELDQEKNSLAVEARPPARDPEPDLNGNIDQLVKTTADAWNDIPF